MPFLLPQETEPAQEGIAEGFREVGDSLAAQIQAVREFRFLEAINWPALLASAVEIILIVLLIEAAPPEVGQQYHRRRQQHHRQASPA